MPELPEVETICRQLEPVLVGSTIRGIELPNPKTVSGNTRDVIGQKIAAVKRRAKVLIIELVNGYRILIHLKMTGQLIYQEAGGRRQEARVTGSKIRYGAGAGKKSLFQNTNLPNKYTRVIVSLSGGLTLFYNDVRKFGWIRIVGPGEKVKFLENLGPEPLSQEFTGKALQKILKTSNRPIKTLLLDQTQIAGVGNIYANEALFLAKIHPEKKAASLTKLEVSDLHKALVKSLEKGIYHGGASDSDYLDARGEKGSMQEHFLVYNRKNELCSNGCGENIRRIVIGGRGTFYCPECQH